MTDHTTRYVIDRFEGDKAFVEGLGNVPRALLPRNAREGDVLAVTVEPSRARMSIDAAARTSREEEMRKLRDSLETSDDSDDDTIKL